MKKRTYYDSTHTLKSVYEFLIKGHLKLYVSDCYITWSIHTGKLTNNQIFKSQVAKIFLPVI